MLFENGVIMITNNLREKVNEKKADHFQLCIPKETIVNIILNEKTEKTGSYICHTCKTAMVNGKIPSMAAINGLHLASINESCYLTELETI